MKLLYYFQGGRKSRLSSGEDFPREMFYGADVWPDASILESEQVETRVSLIDRVLIRVMSKVSRGVLSVSDGKKIYGIQIPYDILLSTSLEMSLMVALRSRIKAERKKAVYFNMLTGRYSFSYLDRMAMRFANKFLMIISISSREYASMLNKLPEACHYLIEFGIDTDYWSPAKSRAVTSRDYYFSVGQDQYRDWDNLIEAFKGIRQKLILINNQAACNGLPQNITHIQGSYYKNNVISDADLRNYYAGAKAVIIPIVRCNKPSGQSVCLQAMAMKIPVILTRTEGIWSDRLQDKVNCLLVEEGSPQSIIAAIDFIENCPLEVGKIVKNALDLVMEYYTYRKFTNSLFNKINDQFLADG